MKMNHYLNVPGLLRRFAKIGLALLLVLPVAFGAGAQDVSPARVSGTVVDQQGMPIVGAGVVVRGTQTGSVTDLDGRFTVMAAKDATLTVSFIGYTTREVPVGTQTDIRIVLAENVQSIDDVVVVGFGTQKKETVTGAIGQLSGKELMRSPVTNISNALVGRIAGMAAVQKTGEAGFEESTIRVRGVGTYAGDQNPLIVIDGIVRDMTAFNMLDPNDVENVNVLKDASATAVYGVRGANGVIIVTTKRGREGSLKISFTANVGFTSPTTLPSLVNSYDYAVLRNEAFANDGKPDDIKVFSQDELWKFRHNRDYTPSEVEAMGHLSPEQKQALLDSPAIYYGSTDYMKRIFDAGVSPQQQYSVNISGGTEKVAFFTSVGYSNQKSLTNDFGFSDAASNSGSHKYNFRTNFDFNIIPLTEINVSLSGQVRETKIITDRNSSVDMWGRYRDLMLNIYEAPPFSAPGVSDGRIITDYAGGTIMDSNKGAWGKSPIAYMLEKAQARINQSSLNTSIRIRHRMDYLVEGLSVRGALSYDHYFTKTLRVTPNLPVYSITRNPADPAELLYYGGEHNAKSYEETGWGKNRKVYVEAGIDFSRDFGKHAVTAMALVTGERYTSPGLKYNVPRGYYGVVGRVTYGYDQRYLAEFNMGYNGSENFAPGKRFGFFPAVSVGWVVSNEPYFPKNDILTWLKFRASYGQTGNSEIGGDRFLFLPGTWGSHSYGPWNGTPLDGYFFGSSNGSVNNPAFPGKYEQSTGNPDVTWEKKESYNIAAEVRMFRDRLSVTVDLFEEKRNNILTKLGVTPGIIGLSGDALPPVNVGRMSNRGYEIQVSWRDNVGTDFWYEVGGRTGLLCRQQDRLQGRTLLHVRLDERNGLRLRTVQGLLQRRLLQYARGGRQPSLQCHRRQPCPGRRPAYRRRQRRRHHRRQGHHPDGLLERPALRVQQQPELRLQGVRNIRAPYRFGAGDVQHERLPHHALRAGQRHAAELYERPLDARTPCRRQADHLSAHVREHGQQPEQPEQCLLVPFDRPYQAQERRGGLYVPERPLDAQGAYRLDPRIRQCQQPLYLGRQRPGRRHRPRAGAGRQYVRRHHLSAHARV